MYYKCNLSKEGTALDTNYFILATLKANVIHKICSSMQIFTQLHLIYDCKKKNIANCIYYFYNKTQMSMRCVLSPTRMTTLNGLTTNKPNINNTRLLETQHKNAMVNIFFYFVFIIYYVLRIYDDRSSLTVWKSMWSVYIVEFMLDVRSSSVAI